MNAILVSQEVYKEIEADMQEWYLKEHSHWNRIYKDGEKLGEREFAKTHPLTVMEDGDSVVVEIQDSDGKVIYSKRYSEHD